MSQSVVRVWCLRVNTPGAPFKNPSDLHYAKFTHLPAKHTTRDRHSQNASIPRLLILDASPSLVYNPLCLEINIRPVWKKLAKNHMLTDSIFGTTPEYKKWRNWSFSLFFLWVGSELFGVNAETELILLHEKPFCRQTHEEPASFG